MNTVKYIQLKTGNYSLSSGEIKSIKDLILTDKNYNTFKDRIKDCNTIRIYVSSGDLAMRFDGGTPTTSDFVVTGGQHLIENTEIMNVNLLAVTDCNFAMHIGYM